jgi:hypothetical protein
MIEYNKKELLISLHLTKCGGTSFNRLLKLWFHFGYHRHYYNDKTCQLPEKLEIAGLKKIFPVCVHGHFKVHTPYELNKYYPESKQFITIFRNPLTAHLSTYSYIRQCIAAKAFYGENGILETRNIAEGLEDFVENHHCGILNCFPFKVDKDNFRDMIQEHFIHIGVMERMETSLQILAKKLHKPYFKMPVLNSSFNYKEKEQLSEKSKKIFIEKHELEFAIYEYALKLNSRNN